MNIVIPIAGLGQRFVDEGYSVFKPLISIQGSPMILKAIESLGVQGNYIFILRKQDNLEELTTVLHQYAKKEGRDIIKTIKIIEIDYLTDGPASTVLLSKDFINTDEPLLVANCDQIMRWDGLLFKTFCENSKLQGIVVTYYSNSVKNSYALIDEKGLVTKIKEKEVISAISLNGIHYWSKGSLFVESAEAMIISDDRATNGEFYIGPSYNNMIASGQKVGIYHIPNECHHAVGTPDDLREYLRNVD